MKKTILLILVLFIAFATGCGVNRYTHPHQPEQTQSFNKAPDVSDFIGEEKAKEIALFRAGLKEAAVRFDRVELDFGNGIWRYEVEFKNGRTEYDAEIKAEDGTILKWEVDLDD